MADKQAQALKRLTKKLSALRKTLRADERNLLDRMILGDEAAAEVTAHRRHPIVAGGNHPAVILGMANGNYVVAEEGPEVEGHAMAAAVTAKFAEKVPPKNAA